MTGDARRRRRRSRTRRFAILRFDNGVLASIAAHWSVTDASDRRTNSHPRRRHRRARSSPGRSTTSSPAARSSSPTARARARSTVPEASTHVALLDAIAAARAAGEPFPITGEDGLAAAARRRCGLRIGADRPHGVACEGRVLLRRRCASRTTRRTRTAIFSPTRSRATASRSSTSSITRRTWLRANATRFDVMHWHWPSHEYTDPASRDETERRMARVRRRAAAGPRHSAGASSGRRTTSTRTTEPFHDLDVAFRRAFVELATAIISPLRCRRRRRPTRVPPDARRCSSSRTATSSTSCRRRCRARRSARRSASGPTAFVYGFIGNLLPYKGLEELVDAFKTVDDGRSWLLISGGTRPREYGDSIAARGADHPADRRPDLRLRAGRSVRTGAPGVRGHRAAVPCVDNLGLARPGTLVAAAVHRAAHGLPADADGRRRGDSLSARRARGARSRALRDARRLDLDGRAAGRMALGGPRRLGRHRATDTSRHTAHDAVTGEDRVARDDLSVGRRGWPTSGRAAAPPAFADARAALDERVEGYHRRRCPTSPTRQAGYYHEFFCPDHAVQLVFNPRDGHHHACPVDGRAFSGEPFDCAWGWSVNDALSDAALRAAVRRALGHAPDRARRGRRRSSARPAGLRRALPDDAAGAQGLSGRVQPARVCWSALDESVWIIRLAWAAALARDAFAPAELALPRRWPLPARRSSTSTASATGRSRTSATGIAARS